MYSLYLWLHPGKIQISFLPRGFSSVAFLICPSNILRKLLKQTDYKSHSIFFHSQKKFKENRKRIIIERLLEISWEYRSFKIKKTGRWKCCMACLKFIHWGTTSKVPNVQEIFLFLKHHSRFALWKMFTVLTILSSLKLPMATPP